jgi:hypothetical protein
LKKKKEYQASFSLLLLRFSSFICHEICCWASQRLKAYSKKKKTCKTKIAQERIMMDGKNLISSLL